MAHNIFSIFSPLPHGLKYILVALVCLSLFFVFIGFYCHYKHDGTSWNFGSMGMYSSIDYPGNRIIYAYIIDKGHKIQEIDLSPIRDSSFAKYESFLSLPTQKNAQALKKLMAQQYQIDPQNITIIIKGIKYNAGNNSLRKYTIKNF